MNKSRLQPPEPYFDIDSVLLCNIPEIDWELFPDLENINPASLPWPVENSPTAAPSPVPDTQLNGGTEASREAPTLTPTAEDLKALEEFVVVVAPRPCKSVDGGLKYHDVSWNKKQGAWDGRVWDSNETKPQNPGRSKQQSNGKQYTVGSFPSAESAAWAADIMKIKMLLCGWRHRGCRAFFLKLNFSLESYLEDLQEPDVVAITDWREFRESLKSIGLNACRDIRERRNEQDESPPLKKRKRGA